MRKGFRLLLQLRTADNDDNLVLNELSSTVEVKFD